MATRSGNTQYEWSYHIIALHNGFSLRSNIHIHLNRKRITKNCSQRYVPNIAAKPKVRQYLYVIINQVFSSSEQTVGSVAEWFEASLLRWPWSRGLGSTPDLVTLERPCIRRLSILTLSLTLSVKGWLNRAVVEKWLVFHLSDGRPILMVWFLKPWVGFLMVIEVKKFCWKQSAKIPRDNAFSR